MKKKTKMITIICTVITFIVLHTVLVVNGLTNTNEELKSTKKVDVNIIPNTYSISKSMPSSISAIISKKISEQPKKKTQETKKLNKPKSKKVVGFNIKDNSKINPIPSGDKLTAPAGVFEGPSGKETYYNLDMSGVIYLMRNLGYSEQDYPYWVREDGVKMFGHYIMVAADLNTRPKGTILNCSLGKAMVVDTGYFANSNATQLDIAVTW